MYKNNRRQFLKKSVLAGLLGIFAPGLVKFNKVKPRRNRILYNNVIHISSLPKLRFYSEVIEGAAIMDVKAVARIIV